MLVPIESHMSYVALFSSYHGVGLLVKLPAVPLFTYLVRGESLESELQYLASKNCKHHPHRATDNIFRYTEPFRRGSPPCQTDGRTDRWKDGQNYDSNSVRLTTCAKSGSVKSQKGMTFYSASFLPEHDYVTFGSLL